MGNLKPVRSMEEAREKGRAGGIASGIARRKKRDLRLALLALMDGVEDGQNGTERIAAALFKKAVDGDIKAIELCHQWSQQAKDNAGIIGLDELFCQ